MSSPESNPRLDSLIRFALRASLGRWAPRPGTRQRLLWRAAARQRHNMADPLSLVVGVRWIEPHSYTSEIGWSNLVVLEMMRNLSPFSTPYYNLR